jgi:tetratricopeptide (TPR) repeat protein
MRPVKDQAQGPGQTIRVVSMEDGKLVEQDQIQPQAVGKIITFYSYKGGTGRSMALANAGVLLSQEEPNRGPSSSEVRAEEPRGVLMIDWDLEAPGLHRFYQRDFSAHLGLSPRGRSATKYDEKLKHHAGLVDFFEYVAKLRMEPASPSNPTAYRQRAFEEFTEKYVMATDHANLSLVKAGCQDDQYGERVRKFNWEEFFNKDTGFLTAFRQFLKKKYRYVLIDSRTGLTDTSGICTQRMPEKLVAVFVLNHQNIEGILEVLKKVAADRLSASDPAPFMIFPLVSRVATNRSTPRQKWLEGGDLDGENLPGYRRQFEQLFRELFLLRETPKASKDLTPEEMQLLRELFPLHETACDLRLYFNKTWIPHDDDYAFGEKIAVLRDTRDEAAPGYRYVEFTRRLVTLDAPWQLLPGEQAELERLRAQDKVKGAEAVVASARLEKRISRAVGTLVLAGFLGFGGWQVLLDKTNWGQQYQLTRAADTLAQNQQIDDVAKAEWALAQVRLENSAEVQRALDQIRNPGDRLDALLRLSEAWTTLGQSKEGAAALRQARQLIEQPPLNNYSKNFHLLRLAIAWARLGDRDTAQTILSQVAGALPEASPVDAGRFSEHISLALTWKELDFSKEALRELKSVELALWKGIRIVGGNVYAERDYPDLCIAWAQIGYPDRAEDVALQMDYPVPRGNGIALTAAAIAWVGRGDSSRVNALVQRIERLDAKVSPSGSGGGGRDETTQQSPSSAFSLKAIALAEIGVAWAQYGRREEARKLLRTAEAAASALEPPSQRNLILAYVAQAWGRANEFESGLSLARTISDDSLRSTALAELAKARARQGNLDAARELLPRITNGFQRAEVHAALAVAYAAAGDLKQCGEMVSQIADDSRRLEAYARVLSAWTARSDSRWADLDRQIARRDTESFVWTRLAAASRQGFGQPAAAR